MWKYTWYKNCDILSRMYSTSYLPSILTFVLASTWHSDILSGILSSILLGILVWHFPDIDTAAHSLLKSGIRRPCLLSSRWHQPGSAHWDLELAVEVRRDGGRKEGRKEGRKGRQEGRKERRKENATLIKSRNRQLAGGEILYMKTMCKKISLNFRAFKRFKQDTFGRGSPQWGARRMNLLEPGAHVGLRKALCFHSVSCQKTKSACWY